MTYQQDPERPNERLTPNSVPRRTEGFGLIPIIAGAAILFLVVAGFFWSVDDQAPRQSNVPTQSTQNK